MEIVTMLTDSYKKCADAHGGGPAKQQLKQQFHYDRNKTK